MGKQTLGQELIEAMGEVIAYQRGSRKLKERTAKIPPRSVDVASIRHRLRLSQAAFAHRFGFSVRAVQDWEQHRRTPQGSARILLKVIETHPEAVEKVLELDNQPLSTSR
jgi:putative transcriptional regulator